MRDAETVKVVYGCCNLVDDLPRSGLGDDKLAILEIGEQVSSLEQLHHNLNVVLAFENVKKSYYAWMLTHF